MYGPIPAESAGGGAQLKCRTGSVSRVIRVGLYQSTRASRGLNGRQKYTALPTDHPESGNRNRSGFSHDIIAGGRRLPRFSSKSCRYIKEDIRFFMFPSISPQSGGPVRSDRAVCALPAQSVIARHGRGDRCRGVTGVADVILRGADRTGPSVTSVTHAHRPSPAPATGATAAICVTLPSAAVLFCLS